MTIPSEEFDFDLNNEEKRYREYSIRRSALHDRRSSLIAELGALDHRLRHQRKASISLLRMATLTSAILAAAAFSVAIWGDNFSLSSDTLILVITLVAVLLSSVSSVYALYRNRRLTNAFYETAASRFQREIIRNWHEIDEAEQELRELRARISSFYEVDGSESSGKGEDTSGY